MLQIYGIFLLTHPLNNTFDKTHCLVYCKEQSLPFRCLSRTKKYGVRIFHVSMHVQCHPRLSWLKCFSLTFFNSPLTSANKTHHDKLRTERDTKKFRNCVVECEHIFFNQTCNGGCNIGLKFRNEKHEFIRTSLNDFASKTLFVLLDIFPVQVVLLKRFLPRKWYIVYLFCVVQTRGFCHFFLKVEQQNSKFAPRCRSPHVIS